MTLLKQYEVGCNYCGYSGKGDLYDSVNVKVTPELKQLVAEKKINYFVCPQCGGKNELLKNFLYTDTDKGLWVWCYPERQRGEYEEIKKKIDSVSKTMKTEFGEEDFIEPKIVFGFDELLEIIS